MPPPPLVSLPIDSHLGEIVAALREGPNLVLVAEPGAGKTTRVPPAVAMSGVLSPEHPVVVMLQPRRVAARAAAERIGEERGWRVGEEVGYQVRFERRIGPRTVVRVVTEAILSRQLLSDPELPGVGCVILDEFHERSVHSDLALALLREVQQSIRPDLKIIVMSATLDAGPVAEFLGGGGEGAAGSGSAAGQPARIIKVPGRVFPVELEYRVPKGGGYMEDHAAAAISSVIGQDGHILCFLPGAEEIRGCAHLGR